MPETLLQFQTPIVAPDNTSYKARACGSLANGLWEAWLEFTPMTGGPTVRSGRETTQPNHTDTVYWATGLSAIYLEGALRRALDGPVKGKTSGALMAPPMFDGPAPSVMPATGDLEPVARAILDPFSVYAKGEALLRKQLAALSSWHLVNIIVEYELAEEPTAMLNRMPHVALIDAIVSGVRSEARAARQQPE